MEASAWQSPLVESYYRQTIMNIKTARSGHPRPDSVARLYPSSGRESLRKKEGGEESILLTDTPPQISCYCPIVENPDFTCNGPAI